MIKTIKPITNRLHSSNHEGATGNISLQFCLSMTSQIDLLRSSIEENDQLYFVAVVE